MNARSATLGLLAALLVPAACAGFIGIDEPHVVGQDAGDPDSAKAPADAGGDVTVDGDAASPTDATGDAVDAAEASPAEAPSCRPGGAGRNDCGPQANESCCASPLVDGGTFLRSYDAGADASQEDPTTVSPFRLDRFEITVGRYRAFVDQLKAGWLPADGSGKHVHLNNGHGLNAGSESGWVSMTWDMYLGATPGDLSCDPVTQTWTQTSTTGDDLPLTCLSWFEAYAFCIWDGGFLPSEAEWYYAAAGGAQQRTYPWSKPPMSPDIGCTDANYSGCPSSMAPWKGGFASPMGDSRWGQADLAGNLQEWVLDAFQPSYPACNDCAFLSLNPGDLRRDRGGSFGDQPAALQASARGYDTPSYGGYSFGARCARPP
jgi:formylglycine-generating enzyme required for sulfatase activity